MKPISIIRKELGMSQRLFASQLGISQSLLAKLETGYRAISTDLLGKIAKIEEQLSKNQLANSQSKENTIEVDTEFNSFVSKYLRRLSNNLRVCELQIEQENEKLQKLSLILEHAWGSFINQTDIEASIAELENRLLLRKAKISFQKTRKKVFLLSSKIAGYKAQINA